VADSPVCAQLARLRQRIGLLRRLLMDAEARVRRLEGELVRLPFLGLVGVEGAVLVRSKGRAVATILALRQSSAEVKTAGKRLTVPLTDLLVAGKPRGAK
jgi:hypothetical protein